MKKFIIITSPEYESFILEEIGRAGLPHLIEIRRSNFRRMKLETKKEVDFNVLCFRLNDSYRSLLDSEPFEPSKFTPSKEELEELMKNPEKVVNEIAGRLEDGRKRLEEVRIKIEETKAKLIEIRAKLEALRALKPEELKKCLAVGIIRFTKITGLGFTAWPRLEEHLLRFEDVTYKVVNISPEEGFLFVFGPEERRSWVEALFMVFDVKDIFNVLSTRDILLALNIKKRDETLEEYEEEVNTLKRFVEGEEDLQKLKDELAPVLGKAAFIDQFLSIFLDKEASLPRTKLVSVLEGRVPPGKVSQMKELINEVEKKIGGPLFIKYEDSY